MNNNTPKIMKKLLFILLALPVLATAQEKPIQVPPCVEGNSFTIRIPVRFDDNMTVQYAWYRNDTLIDDTHTLLLGEKVIAYTIPASEAYGSAVYHFTYNLHDDHDGEWTDSPHYLVTFHIPPPLKASEITGSTSVCANATGLTYSVTNVADVSYSWTVPTGWTITAGQGTNSITATARTASGNVSVTLSNSGGSSEPRTLAVTVKTPSTITRSDGDASQTVCQNAAMTSIHYTRGGSATDISIAWSPSAPGGVVFNPSTGGIGGGVLTTAGTFTYTVTTSGSSPCAEVTATGTITVNALPAQPSTITGTTPVCAGKTGLTYSITNVTGTTYDWVLPSGWAQTAGTTTNSITVTAGAAGGDIKVTPKTTASGCVGTARTLAVSTTCNGCNSISSGGTISSVAAAAACSNGITSGGTISSVAAAAACSSGITSGGTISSVTAAN